MYKAELKIDKSRHNGSVVFRLSGRVVAETVPPLARSVEETERADHLSELHFDLQRVEFIDSRGVGALLSWHKHFMERDVDFRLLNVGGTVLRTLKICNLSAVLNIGPRPKDLAERMRKKCHDLLASHEYTEQILAALGEGLVGIDPEGRCLFANPMAERMLGYSEAQLLGRPLHEAVLLTKGACLTLDSPHSPLVEVARNGGKPFHGEFSIFHEETGEQTPVAVVATPIRSETGIVGAVIGFLNITDRKRMEEALLTAARLEATATLAGGIAH
ncbi:MAG: anti-sigma factor antagonist, partial [Candidatus Sumerlaeota bacterium]|nr:anti-sigma factor antagonist [Candidatus Sumerlaeota bacterium]